MERIPFDRFQYRSLAKVAVGTIMSTLVGASMPVCEAAQADARSAFVEIYAKKDAAFNRADVDGYFHSMLPGATFSDAHGTVHSLDEERVTARRMFRKPEGEKVFVLRAKTSITSVDAAASHATVRGKADVETYMVNDLGTSVDGHDVVDFSDEWERSASGWRLLRERVLGSTHGYKAAPSPEAVEALRQMRQTRQQIQDFNNADNYSSCMTSDGMQKYDYQQRQAYCQR